ncbi:guanine nucleotide exchange factor [Mycena maculata]|uniref:Guanine nucleotide exchange factor n=1 Tax=Mycena maculata TaxID=230809 RepID=A0AAD7HBP3_9AGAR|nr:guanine nucleotide exchange factor [Mycena maculata]
MSLLQQYHAASAQDIHTVLDGIVNAPPFTFDEAARSELIQVLLKDLKAAKRIPSKDAALALLAVKTLGKNPTGSQVLGTASNLSTLLALVAAHKDDAEASGEALRCIANALLLIERARGVFVSKEVNGGEVCIALLQKSTNPDQIFILARILFLATVHASPFLIALVEEKHHGHTVIDVLAGKLDLLLVSLLSGTRMAKEAMVDILKFAFNILMHYPKAGDGSKVIGDGWSPKLDPILAPLLRVFHALPPTSPAPVAAPLTHVIHSLITIPVSASLRSEWFGPAIASSPRASGPSTSSSGSGSGSSSPKTLPVVIPPSSQRADSSSSSSRTHSPVRSSTLDRALSVLAAGRRSLSRSPSPIPPSSHAHKGKAPAADTLLRAYDLLSVALLHYFPDAVEPDDSSVRERIKAEAAAAGTSGAADSLDDELSPLVMLLTRLCAGDADARARTREWLVPADLDRSAAAGPLESRPDTLGRCMRLLGSVYHARLKDSVGELLYAVCDEDAGTMSTLLGYGNVAGFLFNKGIMSAPPPPTAPEPSASDAPGSGEGTSAAAAAAALPANINPITGTAQEAKAPEPEMTPEEKEREMEKLFVLFDRLERTGALPPSQNPMRKAIEKAQTASAPVVPEDEDD